MSDDDTGDFLPQLEVAASDPSSVLGVGLLEESSPKLHAQKLQCLEKYFALLTKSISFKDFCRDLMVITMEVLPCEAASLLELDPTRSFLFFRTSAGKCSDKVQSFQVPVGQGIAGSVVTSKKHFLLDRANENQLHLKSIGDAIGFKVENLLAIPLLIRGEVFGVFELLNRNGMNGFSIDDVDFALRVSDWMSKAIEIRLMINYQTQKSKEGIELKAA